MAKRLNLVAEKGNALRVMVANGEKLSTQGLCKVIQRCAQGYYFATGFLVLPVNECDLVLDVQWLLSHGYIIWYFSSLTMKFKYKKQCCVLKGIVPRSL